MAADLIKAVRALNPNGPGKDGQAELSKIWKHLTANTDTHFHAAQETILRWLLKSMNGSSPEAETLRRYPLTWTILGAVFKSIPLFSLAKSLADRRFISILQQTLKEISQPSNETGATAGKRKRDASPDYNLDKLKLSENCVYSGQAIFDALAILLTRCDETNTSSHDRIGAEHLKSLFCSTAKEAMSTVAPLLFVCKLLLTTGLYEFLEGWETWPKTISLIWGLHLQGDDDPSEVVTHIFVTAVEILAQLEPLSPKNESIVSDEVAKQWSLELQDFMHRNFILPARASFLRDDQQIDLVSGALNASDSVWRISVPVLYFLAATSTENLIQQGVRNGHDAWMKKLFQILDNTTRALRGSPSDRIELIQCVLRQARKRKMPVGFDDLRAVCHEYALHEGHTEWDVVANISQCDPDVFRIGEAGETFLKEICQRTLDEKDISGNHGTIGEILDAVVQSFRTSRNFSSFLRLWLEQMCAVERKTSEAKSPWFDIGRTALLKVSLHSLVEQELSSQQLRSVVEWAESQKPQPQALSLWLSTITQGVRSEDFKEASGSVLLRLVGQITDSTLSLAALKWRVISSAVAWAPSAQRDAHWVEVKGKLAKILRKQPIKSANTFEAFKCCCQVSVAMSPDGEHLTEAENLLEIFSARLAEAISLQISDFTFSSELLEPDINVEYGDETSIHQYLAWYLRGSTRLNRAYFGAKGVLPPTLQYVTSDTNSTPGGLGLAWESLLSNEHNLNESKVATQLVDRLVEALKGSRNAETWPGEKGQLWLQKLTCVPLEAISRVQREAAMSALIECVKERKSSQPMSSEGWVSTVSLATKIMARPTFYEGMSFQHLVEIADMASEVVRSTPTTSATLLEFIERFGSMTMATFRQMTESDDARSNRYLSDCETFVAQCATIGGTKDETKLHPLHLTILKSLFKLVAESPNRSQDRLAILSKPFGAGLKHCVESVLADWVADRKLFAKNDLHTNFRLLAAIDAAESGSDFAGLHTQKASRIKKLESTCQEAMIAGDLRAWKLLSLLRRKSPQDTSSRPNKHQNLENLPIDLRVPFQKEYIEAIIGQDDVSGKLHYLKDLIEEYRGGCKTDGQLIAMQTVIEQVLDSTEPHSTDLDFDLSAAHGSLSQALASETTSTNGTWICRILHSVLEKRPQAISQWNIEVLFASIASLSSPVQDKEGSAPYLWLCKLVEIVIKKHRIRLEGHYHVLLAVLQPLLSNLVLEQCKGSSGEEALQSTKAGAFARLVSMICEPTAGAVARSQHGALDSATDAAKRSAGRHMYLVLMQYVKLQLEANVHRIVRESLEPAMNSIFDITPAEGRKILNDAMDANGRAILREMFKRYTKFGKWSGV